MGFERTTAVGAPRAQYARHGPFLLTAARAMALAALLATVGSARAQAEVPAAPSTVANVRTTGLRLFGGAALERGGLAIGAGGLRRLTPRLVVGATVEWNPWIDPVSAGVASGVVNAYGTLSWRWLEGPSHELRGVAHAGASALLFSTVGARAGSVGVFGGLSVLTLALHLRDGLWLDVSPELTLSVPALHGVPFVYRQYRLCVGLTSWW